MFCFFFSVNRQNHSEIEKRRRDKMNMLIAELLSLVPMCKAMSRKLDKLTMLRLTVQHMKSICGNVHSYVESNSRPPRLTDLDMKHVVQDATDPDCFLFVIGCERGRVIFVSESVSSTLNCTQVYYYTYQLVVSSLCILLY